MISPRSPTGRMICERKPFHGYAVCVYRDPAEFAQGAARRKGAGIAAGTRPQWRANEGLPGETDYQLATLSEEGSLAAPLPGVLRDRSPGRLLAAADSPGHHEGKLQAAPRVADRKRVPAAARSEEHTSELQSRQYLVCR